MTATVAASRDAADAESAESPVAVVDTDDLVIDAVDDVEVDTDVDVDDVEEA